MKVLVVNCTAMGVPKKWSLPPSDTFNWPRLLHLAWEFYDEKSTILEMEDHYVNEDSVQLTSDKAVKAKIEFDDYDARKIPISELLEKFSIAVNEAEFVVAHNLKFIEGVVGAEYIRTGLRDPLPYSDSYSLMQEATFFCKIRGPGGKFKWPSLTQLFMKTFGQGYEGAGNAKTDARATGMCLFRLIETNVIEIFD